MVKKEVNFKLILVIIAAIGFVLFCVGAIMGGRLSNIPASFKQDALPAGAEPLLQDDQNMDSADYINTIHSVELNLIHSDLTIKIGKVFDISGTGACDAYVKDGVLYAGAGDTTYSLGGVTLDSSKVCGYGKYVLTIPDSAELRYVKINTKGCNIDGDGLKADNIEIHSTRGISLKSCKIDLDYIIANNKCIMDNAGKVNTPVHEYGKPQYNVNQ